MLRPLGELRFNVILSAVIALAGCGGGEGGEATEKPEAPAEEKPAPKGIKSVDLSKLPKVGDYLPPMEFGRVELAAPEGWLAAARDSKFVARFYRKKGELPRIDIKGDDDPVKELTEENASEITAKLAKTVAKNVLIEAHKPLKFGDRVWIRHVRKVKYAKDDAQSQTLQTIYDGRLYSIDLIVMGQTAEELLKERDNGYAVAANMKLKPQEKKSFALPTEQPAEAATEKAP